VGNKRYYTVEPEVRTPNWEEIQVAINTLKNNKASGENKINSELLKARGQDLSLYLFKLIKTIWEEKKIPKC